MRPSVSVLLVFALSAAACGGDEAGYRAPDDGCVGWSFCDSIETRGRFDALQGFLRAGEVIAYRAPRPDGTAAAWWSGPDGEASIAARVVVAETAVRRGPGEVVVAVPRFAGDYDSEPMSTRSDLRRWTPGGEAVLLAENTVRKAWALCSTGEWLWTAEGEDPENRYSNCGNDVLRNLRNGQTVTVPGICTLNPWAARFSRDGRFLLDTPSAIRVDLATGARTVELPGWKLDSKAPDGSLLVFAERVSPDARGSYPDPDLLVARTEDLTELRRLDDAAPFGVRTLSPDGAWLAYDRRDAASGWDRLDLVRLADGRAVTSGRVDAMHRAVAFSPAGDRVAYLAFSDVTYDPLADLVLVELGDGTSTLVDTLASGAGFRHGQPNLSVAFDAAGGRLLYVRGAEDEAVRNRLRELVVVDVSTGATRPLTPPVACPNCAEGGPPELPAALSPDGRWLAWVCPRGLLFLADLAAGGDGVQVSDGPVTDLVFGDGELAWISDGHLLVAPLAP